MEETEGDQNQGTALQGEYKISENRNFDGSKQSLALICWVKDSYAIHDGLLEELRLKAEELQTINANDPAKQPENGTEPAQEWSQW